MEKRIKAIVLDIGGVLAVRKKLKKLGNGIHHDAAKEFGLGLDQYFDAIDSIYVKSMEGRVDKKEVLDTFSKHLGFSKSKIEKTYYNLYKHYLKDNKQLFEQAFELKKQGYKIAILSDQWHLSKEALLSKKNSKKFDEVVLSCDVGVRKPDLEIYKIILKRLKLKGEEVLFIDNQPWNIEAGKKLGIKGIIFKNNKQMFKQLFEQLK